MSLHSYMVSYELARQDPPFSALIMAAMRKADSQNSRRLQQAFPEIHAELQARYEAPGGRLGSENITVPPVEIQVVDETDRSNWAERLPIPPHIQAEVDKLPGGQAYLMPRDDLVHGEPIISADGEAELQRRFFPDVVVPEDEL